MSTRYFPGGKGRPTRKADNLAAISELYKKMWEPRRLITLWASTACYRDSFTIFFTFLSKVHFNIIFHLWFLQFINTSIKIKINDCDIVCIYVTLTYVSVPVQLQQVREDANEGATLRLHYESCLQGIHAEQITTGNTCESTTQRWRSHQ
jgi:hypothetical protein